VSVNTWQSPNTWAGGLNPPVGTVTINSVVTTTTTATVSFSYDNTDQTGFDYRLDGGSPVDIFTTNPFVISSLAPDTSFTVEVRAYNLDGNGAWSTSFPFTTGEISVTECFNGFTGTIVDNTILEPVGFIGFINDLNGFKGGICNELCDN